MVVGVVELVRVCGAAAVFYEVSPTEVSPQPYLPQPPFLLRRPTSSPHPPHRTTATPPLFDITHHHLLPAPFVYTIAATITRFHPLLISPPNTTFLCFPISVLTPPSTTHITNATVQQPPSSSIAFTHPPSFNRTLLLHYTTSPHCQTQLLSPSPQLIPLILPSTSSSLLLLFRPRRLRWIVGW